MSFRSPGRYGWLAGLVLSALPACTATLSGEADEGDDPADDPSPGASTGAADARLRTVAEPPRTVPGADAASPGGSTSPRSEAGADGPGGTVPPDAGARTDGAAGTTGDAAVRRDAVGATMDTAAAPDRAVAMDGAAQPLDASQDMAAPPPPAGTTFLRFLPDRRTFTGSLEVRLEADHAGATIYYTTDDRPPTKASTVYAAPIQLTRSTIVRAFVSSPSAGDGPVYNQGFVKLAADAASFSSDIPIFLVHSYRSRPQLKGDGIKQAILMVFAPDPATGRATLTQVPALDTRIGIRVRGSSSEGFPKKQYKIETWGGAADTDMDVPILGLPSESDWIINAGYPFDRAYVRNAFVYAVSNRLGRYAPRTRFVEVFFTERNLDTSFATDYLGLYTLIEKIKVSKNRLALAKLRATDLVEPAISGGYIFRIDRLNAGEAGFTAGAGPGNLWTQPCPGGKPGICAIMQPLVFDDPDELVMPAAQKSYLTQAVNDFANLLGNRGDYGTLADVSSFIDHHAINMLPKNPDAFRLSGFFYKDRGGKIAAGPVWDFDRTMACADDGRANDPTWWDPTNTTNDATNFFDYGWYRGMFDDAAFKAAYFQRLRTLVGGEFAVARLQPLVDDLVRQLGREAPARDARRWPGVAPRGSFAAEVTLLKDWLRRRVEWISGCLQLADPESCRGP